MSKLNTIDIDKLIRRTTRSLSQGAYQYMHLKGQSKVKNIMIDVIEEKIYDRYTPEVYKRRGNNKGLKDRRNLKSEVKTEKVNDELFEGYLYILNVTPRDVLHNMKKSFPYADATENFLFSIKDEGRVFNLWNSPSWGIWGNMGRPLYITVEVDRRVQKSKELRSELKHACLKKARHDMDKWKS